MKSVKINLPILIILSGIVFSLYLFSRIPDEIYFSGDAGLKALLARQFSTGNLHINLELSVPQWVNNLWENGLYPFEPPFSYKISNRYYITFPFTFPLVTAPFYNLFGFRGLYLIPLLSTWLIWFNFYRVCEFFKINRIATSAGLLVLIFASPLTMYSAMYWEHTLAVSLAFTGIGIVLTKAETNFTRRDAINSGLLIGLSVWFRPEFFALVGIILLLVLVSLTNRFTYLQIISKHQGVFLVSLIATVAGFLIANKFIYNHPLGAHALQVVEQFSLQERLKAARKIFGLLFSNLQKHFPIIYFVIIFTALSPLNLGWKLTVPMRKILLLSIPIIFLIPILLPSDGGKQWGPRFFLILIPLFSLLAVFLLNTTLPIRKFAVRYVSSAVFVALFVVGVNINLIPGIEYCYSRGNPEALEVLNFFRQDNSKVVAVAHQYINQSFEAAFKDKFFFLTKKPDNVKKLSIALHEQGYQKFVYVCAAYDPCYKSPTIPNKLEFEHNGQILNVQLQEVKKNQKYIIQEAGITQINNKNS